MSSIETDADPETSVTVAASLHFVYAVLPNNRQCNVLFFDVHCFVLDFILYCIFFYLPILVTHTRPFNGPFPGLLVPGTDLFVKCHLKLHIDITLHY